MDGKNKTSSTNNARIPSQRNATTSLGNLSSTPLGTSANTNDTRNASNPPLVTSTNANSTKNVSNTTTGTSTNASGTRNEDTSQNCCQNAFSPDDTERRDGPGGA